MSRTFPKPPIASFSFWKALFVGIGASMLFTFLIWLFRTLAALAAGKRDISLLFTDVAGGFFFVPLSIYSYWAWRPRRKHARWHRWLVNLLGSLYVSTLLLLASLTFWNVVIDSRSVGLSVNLLIIGVFVFMWLLPLISYELAKYLENLQHALNPLILKWGIATVLAVAGVVGAFIGSRVGDIETGAVVLAILSTALAIGFAQYAASSLWGDRPWAKEGEE